MTRGIGLLTALAVLAAALTGVQTTAQAQTVGACPPGTQLIPARYNGAGNPVSAYCAAAQTQGNFDPYTGRNARDPQATPTEGGPSQFIPRTR